MHAKRSGSWEAVAARQHGVLSRRQATSLGITRRQIDGFLKRGSWIRMHSGVYRAAAAPETWQQPLMAASLWADGKAVISGRSAAALWEFDGYWRSQVELCGCSDLSPPTGIVYRQVKRLRPADTTPRSGIRVTSVARTILDLTRVVSPRMLERTLDEALRKGLVTTDAVRHCLERNAPRGKKRVAQLRALLAERRDQLTSDSALETDVAGVIRQYGLPPPVKRYRVIEADHFIAEVDLAWPSKKVAVQVHGSTFHRRPRTWENDQRVENRLQLHGWFVVKITRRMVEDEPEQCLELLTQALTTRNSG